ncbi:hypothetical protein CROQUDRAFT_90521 [Cronartium quercuum f. sp. fusiforme G11]|uniref:Uncharacterized protein n=1 Tax=Cronartium quercuum f. sp. fusiforme G11 TaxID=708437 RepID=A0A9P6NQ34_9BASI|nr:hypothetical protein CROQUDRAFT_90521 [Cronartium quercuum f. sp. fusiforme G11]
MPTPRTPCLTSKVRGLRGATSQLPFSTSQQSQGFDSSNHIFASLASLLQQWLNTYNSNGHTILPGLVPEGTLLYHGTTHDIQPTGFEWLVFDAEMSYAIIAGWVGPSTLRIYSRTRTLRVLYCDGQSARIGLDGTLDSQYLSITLSHIGIISLIEIIQGGTIRAPNSFVLLVKSRDSRAFRMVSLYDRVTSLARWRAREGIELEGDKHRLITIDQADASLVKRRLRQVLARKAEDEWRHQLGEDQIGFQSFVPSSIAAQAVIYPAPMPYLDLAAFRDSGAHSIGPALDRCTIAFTSGLRHGFRLTESELVIISAIEKTLGRVCGTLLEIVDQILQVQFPCNQHLSPDPNILEQRVSDRVFFWKKKMVNDLRQWLGGHDDERFPRRCEWDEQCAIPNWPLVRFRDPGRFPGSNKDRSKPICVSRDVSRWIVSDTVFPPRSPWDLGSIQPH